MEREDGARCSDSTLGMWGVYGMYLGSRVWEVMWEIRG